MTIVQIQAATAQHFGITVTELLSFDRHKSLVFARMLAMSLCRLYTMASYPEIGRAFGDRDHTTVMSACKRVVKIRTVDAMCRRHIDALIGALDREDSLEPRKVEERHGVRQLSEVKP